jgi:hypothetical protein
MLDASIRDFRKYWTQRLPTLKFECHPIKNKYTEAVRITGVLVLAHRPELQILENITFRILDLFLSSGEGGRYLVCGVPKKELISITGQTVSYNNGGIST